MSDSHNATEGPNTESAAMHRLIEAFLMRAESLGDHVFDFFRAPSFFPQIESGQVVQLKGGRGTGKTTLLRCLSYEGKHALAGKDNSAIRGWPYYGLYFRINTNRVAAFKGSELDQTRWVKLFGHYINLELTALLVEFVEWYQEKTGSREVVAEEGWEELSLAFGFEETSELVEFKRQIKKARIRFERQINNISDESGMLSLSMLGAPIDLLCQRLAASPEMDGKRIFFLLDEYENLLDYQQQVCNTLIKHATSTYTFKIAVKELGFRVRSTINPTEQLNSPADYVVLDIADKLRPKFQAFAEEVCESRLAAALAEGHGVSAPIRMGTLFPGLSDEAEALRLGVKKRLVPIRKAVADDPGAISDEFNGLSPLRQYFCAYWAGSQSLPISDVIRERLDNKDAWERRFGNYRHSILFTLRRGQPGRRKYYAGWPLLCKLASGNVRYMLELVVSSLTAHIDRGSHLTEPLEAETQTSAAQAVGKKNLQELEGLSIYGASLTKLLLGMGRVFQLLAAHGEGHAPEITQFYVPNLQTEDDALDERELRAPRLLSAAVDSLALLRLTGTKAQAEGDTQAYDYTIHPIFAPFFEISHRRKRKLPVTERELLGLIDHPKWAIGSLLQKHNRVGIAQDALPDQLRLFESYYAPHA